MSNLGLRNGGTYNVIWNCHIEINFLIAWKRPHFVLDMPTNLGYPLLPTSIRIQNISLTYRDNIRSVRAQS